MDGSSPAGSFRPRYARPDPAMPVADVLPPRDFLENQQADFVTAVKEVWRLRIMRRAHQIALQLLLQDQRVLPLHASRHGGPHKGKGLVPVQPAQLQRLAVQLKTVRRKAGVTKADAGRVFVYKGFSGIELRGDSVKLGILQTP